jgi:hypothetical protein
MGCVPIKNSGGIRPQSFKVIILPYIFKEYMDYDIAIIEKDPSSFIYPLNAQRPYGLLL